MTLQWAVVRSKVRSYGYGLRSNQRLSYLQDGYNSGWYKYKRDAIQRAEELNKVEKQKEHDHVAAD